VDLVLEDGWKQKSDISWRASTWGLRRMAQGGIVLEPAPMGGDKPRLQVKHVGEFGAHAVAKKAGFQKGDIILSVDGKTDLTRETDALAYLLKNKKPGDVVGIQVLRGGKTVDLKLPQQE
jgi:S1-C subfamily serine protease